MSCPENDFLAPACDERLSRRHFLGTTWRSALVLGGAGLATTCPVWLRSLIGETSADTLDPTYAETLLRDAPLARYWISSNSVGSQCLSCHSPEDDAQGDAYDHKEAVVKCTLCAQGCVIRVGERGGCRTRINIDGELRSLVYGRPISVHVDPIEKKPFYHFLPGSEAFSLATAGCPLHCKFCQNWEISQARPEDYPVPYTPPEAIVEATENRNAPIIAFTYNEPTVFTEYLTDIARIAQKHRLACVLVSCGFMNEEPLTEMCSLLDAIKIDLKGFSKEFYRRVCSAELAPVLRSIKQVAQSGVHLEIVNLVVPTLNDSEEMLTELVKWVVGELGPDVPVHFTRFHPDYQMLNLPPTPAETLEKAYEIAKANGMHYPFVGNVPGHPGNNTYCPNCGKVVIERTGFFVTTQHVKDGECEFCGASIAGVWSPLE
jgi:pyruvate formate lyase activating enzyme